MEQATIQYRRDDAVCGSRRVAPILYGMPAYSEEMELQLKEEKLLDIHGCACDD